jgi:hypothetical protein
MRVKSKAEFKAAIRDQAKRKIGGALKSDAVSRSQYRDNVEQGLKELRQVSSEGGDGKAKRIKNELTYLLNNYLPQYDNRILQLIDDWRRTGDPAYDPGIRARVVQARRDYMGKTQAL